MKQIFISGFWLFVFTASACAQSADTGYSLKDSLQIQAVIDTADSVKPVVTETPVFKLKNKLLNSDADPVSLAVQLKKTKSKDTLFYLIAGILLLLALIKYFNSRYFANMFRVFFNTSLRQSQLTDQLLQDKLPSLFLNLFFIISGGLYVYLLLIHYKLIADDINLGLIFSSMALVGLVYLLKYGILKFTGWVTGYKEVTNTYIFVIFLINKIVGIFLVLFIIMLSFSEIALLNVVTLISLLSIGIFLLLRFFRSYGLLQNQLKISRFHFILYITGVELLPLLLVYKALIIYLNKIL